MRLTEHAPADLVLGRILRLAAYAAAAVTVTSLRVVSLPAQELPAASELAARHDSLVGGRAALETLSSLRMLGTFSIPAAGIEAPLEILKLRPDRYVFRTVLGEGTEVSQGYDGHVAWAVRPNDGPRILEGAERERLIAQADFFGDLHDLARFVSAQTLGTRDFDGRAAWEVRYVRVEGDTLHEFFDRETGLSLGTSRRVRTALGRAEEERTLFGDYRRFGGLLLATTIAQRLPAADVIVRIGFVELDRVTERDVAPPAGVLALIP